MFQLRISFILIPGLFGALSAFADIHPRELIDAAKTNPDSPSLRTSLLASVSETDLKNGTAVVEYGPDFLWAVEMENRPVLLVDEGIWPAPMRKLAGDGPAIWFATGNLRAGWSHSFRYMVGNNSFGGKTDVPAYLPDCYEQPGVPQGKLSEKIVHRSRIYPDMESNYWIYVPAGYDGSTPAALMIYQDGQ